MPDTMEKSYLRKLVVTSPNHRENVQSCDSHGEWKGAIRLILRSEGAENGLWDMSENGNIKKFHWDSNIASYGDP